MRGFGNLKIMYKALILVSASILSAATMFLVAQNGLSSIRSQLEGITLSTNVERYAFATILQEKNYLLNANGATANQDLAAQAFQSAEQNVRTILQTLDRIDASGLSASLLQRSREARTGTNTYADLYRRGVTALRSLQELTQSLETDGETATQQARDYIRTTQDPTKKQIATDILEYTFLIRANEKRYMLTQRAETFAQMNRDFASMMEKLATLERSVANDQERTQVQVFKQAALNYRTAAENWVARNNTLFREILPQMKTLGDQVIQLAFAAAQESAQAMTDARDGILTQLLVIGIAVAIAGILLGLLVASAISRPVVGLTSAMERLAKGELEVEIPSTQQRDEIGVMARSVQVFKENAVARQALEEGQKAEVAQRLERQQRIEHLTSGFGTTVSAVIAKLTRAVDGQHQSARSMSDTAERTSGQSETVATATELARANVESVALAGGELATSIQEISGVVSRTASIAKQAAVEAEETNGKINRLAESAGRIGQIVSMINDIASQTNLLALNATIESARAGEAGKGFAVVANEVKSLAGQTAKATQEIAAQVSAIQQETGAAVEAIRAIGATIAQVNELSMSVASAVEEQGVATANIARSVEQAARGTVEVANNIQQVTRAASETGTMAQNVYQNASTLMEETSSLTREVETFLTEVRAA